jgi:hypothetical protein
MRNRPWAMLLTMMAGWLKPMVAISDCSDCRRPSHSDRCAGLPREVIAKRFLATAGHGHNTHKIARQLYKLMKLAA